MVEKDAPKTIADAAPVTKEANSSSYFYEIDKEAQLPSVKPVPILGLRIEGLRIKDYAVTRRG